MKYIEIDSNKKVLNIVIADSPFIEELKAITGLSYIDVDDAFFVNIGDILDEFNNIIQETVITVPKTITMRQARLQLLALGLLDDVEVVIANIEDATMKRMVQIEWEYAKDVERSSSMIGMLAQAVGLDSEGLDSLFIEAVKL